MRPEQRDLVVGKATFLCLLAGLLILLLGCNGDENPCDGVDCGGDQICLDGICQGGSVSCEPACDDDEVCSDGRCVAQGGGCHYQGQGCSRRDHLQWTDDYFCVDLDTGQGSEAVCAQDCRFTGCPVESECFLVVPGFVNACSTESDCGANEACVDGQCVVAVCRPSQCDVTLGREADCPAGERCDRIANEANYCLPAGEAALGEACLGGLEALERRRFEDGCRVGKACVAGVCHEYCGMQGDCSVEGESCTNLQVNGATLPICVSTCTPGAEESGCTETETCVPTGTSGEGACRPAGSVPVFEACEPGGEGCEPGTICAAEVEGGSMMRCLPVCDLGAGENEEDGRVSSEAQQSRDATCPQPDPTGASWSVWHLMSTGAAVDLYVDGESAPVATIEPGSVAEMEAGQFFQQRSSGTVSWQARRVGDPISEVPLAEGELSLSSGEQRMLILIPVAGRDQELMSEAVGMEDGQTHTWIQAIPDLVPVDVWGTDDEGERILLLESAEFGDSGAIDFVTGLVSLELVAAGTEADPLVTFEELTEMSGARLFAAAGTMAAGDIHPVELVTSEAEVIADLQADQSLPMTCRAAEGGMIGVCMERCDGLEAPFEERCSGQAMGCGPRFAQERNLWSTLCQPQGEVGEGEPCSPQVERPCEEGLYCLEYGSDAAHRQDGGPAGLCTPLCQSGRAGQCGEGRACRLLDELGGYELGECRPVCEPDEAFQGASCPQGLRRCLPEARLVPAGDGVAGAVDVEDRTPYCWPSGTTALGEQCLPGGCEPSGECLFQRTLQGGFIETLLSPYFGGGAQGLACRATCDPFTNNPDVHRCGEGETCLFNFPWNANVGHCAEIVEERSIGETCESPGMACGEDAICVIDGGSPGCLRFCQFTGFGSDGYHRSTCPTGFRCNPLVNDLGICD